MSLPGGDDDDATGDAPGFGWVQGVVRAPSGAFVPGVTLQLGAQVGSTDSRGWFSFPSVPEGEATLFATRPGWSSSQRPVLLAAGEQLSVSLSMVPSRQDRLEVPEPGPDAIVSDGAVTVEFVHGAFLTEDGEAAQGPIDVAFSLLNTPESLSAAPGMLASIDGGDPFQLESFGMVEVVLTAGGAPVLFEGSALLSFPLFAGHPFADGDSIPLWSFDEDAGRWVSEGEGTVDGALFVAEVSHFTWWNADRPMGESGCAHGTLTFPGGAPAPGVTVNTVGIDHLGADFVTTAVDGSFCAPMKRGARSRLSAVTGDGSAIWSWQLDLEAPVEPASCGQDCEELGEVLLSDLTDDADGDGITELAGDCDDGDPAVSPLASDPLVDGLDDDCDGVDGPDADGDGVATSEAGGLDCDDGDPAVRPGATEACNGLDDDCDGVVDPAGSFGAAAAWPDDDGDGYGDGLDLFLLCGMPPGFVANPDDCDDSADDRSPAAPEVCVHPLLGAGVDEDCDGLVDEGGADGGISWADSDGDGYGDPLAAVQSCLPVAGTVSNADDCDDGVAAVFPGAGEVCNGVDDDCDGATDEPGAQGELLFLVDGDGDGYGVDGAFVSACALPAGAAVLGGDCDDGDAATNPGAVESCSDSDDLNCDGSVQYADGDGDGAPACADCDDNDASVGPGATEACDLLDSDCDGSLVDFFADLDLDGWPDCVDPDDDGDGDPDTSDCAPQLDSVYNGAIEACDSIDSDCDGSLVDAWFDTDGDGNPDCVDPDDDNDGVPDAGDCGPLSPAVFPGAPELCDGLDNDCDGTSDACAGANADGVIYGEVSSWALGQSLAHGDLDGDGLDDLVIGSPDGGANLAGLVHVFVGSPSGALLPSLADVAVLGEAAGDQAGSALAADCDLNGDGNDDLVVGAWSNNNTGASSGSVYVLFGPLSGALSLASADVVLRGESAGDWAGWSVACAGDTDGDGFDDLLVGAWREDEGTLDAGAAYLLRGPLAAGTSVSLATADAKLLGSSALDYAGASVAGAGDVNGDGYDDVLIGAWGVDAGGPTAGAAYLVLGPISGTRSLSTADARLLGADPDARAGAMVAGAGDIDGDGYDDLMVGAWSSDVAGTNAGAAYFVFGPVSGDRLLDQADAVVFGLSPGDRLGFSGMGAGDVNGDGFADVVLGAPGRDAGALDSGIAYLLLGSPGGVGSLGQAVGVLSGEGQADQAGLAVLGGADFDGDGVDDVLVGAPFADGLISDGGAAYLQLGTTLLGP